MNYNIYKSATTGTGIMIDEDGQLYIISKNDKKIWTGKLEVVAWPEAETAVEVNRENPMVHLAVNNRSFLEDIGIESNTIDSLVRSFDRE